MTKTHYRKAFKSIYLSSADIVEPTTLTISHVTLESDKSKKTKDSFNTAYFVEKELRDGEPLKPMVLNVHNSKIMACFANSKFIDDWNDIRVTVYVDPNVNNRGSIVEGLRLDPNPPKARPQLTPDHKQWDSAVSAYQRDKNFSEIKKRIDISPENEKLIIEAANVS